MRSIEKPHFFTLTGMALALLILGTGVPAVCQSAESNEGVFGRRPQEPPPKSFRDMLAKQRTEKQKKDHEELVKRGEEAAILSQQLEYAFSSQNQLSPADMSKLESLEKLVSRIRKGLGGDNDDLDEASGDPSAAEPNPSNLREAFTGLKEMTGKLVDELKKTTRFTVSVVAIQSSNSVLKLVRFLRLRR
jgi:hypothetical protein